jgi:hypothetical protein
MAFKRFLACGCSHGELADPVALEAVLAFKRSWKPDTTIHLGDFCDFAALRSGAAGSKDEAASLADDITAGTNFLEQLEPTHIFDGNHEERIYRLLESPNAKVAYCAQKLMGELNDLATRLGARRVPYDIDEGWLQFGDTLFGHGYMFNQAAIRDHAEAFGKCVIAHLHRVGQERGRVRKDATAHCVGFLGEKKKFGYAKTNKSRLAWSQGFAWGEYSDEHCIVRLEQCGPAGWRLPL